MAVGFLSPVPVPQGLTLITAQTFSAVSTLSVNNCFTSTYKNYRIVLNIDDTSSTGASTSLRWRAAGTDNTTSNYYNTARAWSDTGTNDYSVATGSGTGVYLLFNDSETSAMSFDVNNPQTAIYTTMYGTGNIGLSGSWTIGAMIHASKFIQTTQFDGFTIYPSTGTFTGSVRVYGYQNS